MCRPTCADDAQSLRVCGDGLKSFGSAQDIESVAQVIACDGPRQVLLEEEADGVNDDVGAGRGADNNFLFL